MRRIFFVILFITAMLISCSSSVKAYLDTNNNISLEVSLPKYSFKIFEPIDVLFRYINYGLENDSIYHIFDNSLHKMKFHLTDEQGNKYNEKISIDPILGFTQPKYIVKPNDSLITLMKFNNYGRITHDPDSIYFGNRAYFPVGRYTGYAYVESDGLEYYEPQLKSNIIEFEIKNINEEEKQVLELSNHNKIEKIINDFSDSYFIEYFWRMKTVGEYRKWIDNEINDQDLIKAYKEFMRMYPNSYENVYYIISKYINLVANRDINSIKIKIKINIDNLIKKYPNSIISYYLNNKYTQQEIMRKILEDRYHKY